MWPLDGMAVVPVTAWVTVGVEPVFPVGLLGSLIQSLHVEQVLLEGERERDGGCMERKKRGRMSVVEVGREEKRREESERYDYPLSCRAFYTSRE